VGAVMSEDAYPVRWLGKQAVVTLPEHIDMSNADRVREQLLLVINRGAVVLIADLAATVSCDYSGADALARAHRHAVASGTELELVVIADVVRRVVSLSGLDRLVSVYPTLEAAIAQADTPKVPGEPPVAAAFPAVTKPADPGPAAAAQHADHAGELLEWAVSSILSAGMSLQDAAGLPGDLTTQRIAEALERLDDVVREIRHHVFAERDSLGTMVYPVLVRVSAAAIPGSGWSRSRPGEAGSVQGEGSCGAGGHAEASGRAASPPAGRRG
jgi:anti-sigma B factor antagonist